jgi:DNA-binding transcriptional LysR family regulator
MIFPHEDFMPFLVDSLQLKSFIAIAETGSFGKAARTVSRTQSALSLQIKKLEDQLGCQLFDRGGRKVTLTPEGEIFLGYARQMKQLQWEVFSRLREPDVEGEIRFGTPEDFATHYLPDVLARFRKHHPRVQLNVSCDLTLNLLEQFQQGQFDVILVKRDPQSVKGGTKVWREPLVWAAAEGYRPEERLSLVLSPQPCIYRARALAALDRARRTWHIGYTSPSLAGTLAAVRAGFGMTVLPSHMIPEGIHPVGKDYRLPHLADAEVALIKQDEATKVAGLFADYIVASLETLKG